jgi:hypothetical protein
LSTFSPPSEAFRLRLSGRGYLPPGHLEVNNFFRCRCPFFQARFRENPDAHSWDERDLLLQHSALVNAFFIAIDLRHASVSFVKWFFALASVSMTDAMLSTIFFSSIHVAERHGWYCKGIRVVASNKNNL